MPGCVVCRLSNDHFAIDWTSSGGPFIVISPDKLDALIDAIVAARADWIRH